jgi:hypothetical protein
MIENSTKKALFKTTYRVDWTCVVLGVFLIGLTGFLVFDVLTFELNWIDDNGGWTGLHIFIMSVMIFVTGIFALLSGFLFYAGIERTSFMQEIRHYRIYIYDMRNQEKKDVEKKE